MVSKVYSGTVIGIDAWTIEIEVDISQSGGVPGRDGMVSIVGLPDAAVKESRDRIFPAFASSGFVLPRGFAVVNLAPAGLRKEGAAFDFAADGKEAALGGLLPASVARLSGLWREIVRRKKKRQRRIMVLSSMITSRWRS